VLGGGGGVSGGGGEAPQRERGPSVLGGGGVAGSGRDQVGSSSFGQPQGQQQRGAGPTPTPNPNNTPRDDDTVQQVSTGVSAQVSTFLGLQ